MTPTHFMQNATKPSSVYEEPARRVPVVGEYDIIVCGGGTSGCPAAINAARQGARVALIEKFSYIGGVPIHALNPAWHGTNQVYQGLLEEMIRKAYAFSGWDMDPFEDRAVVVDPDAQRAVLSKMLQDAGVDVFLHSWIAGAVDTGDGHHLLLTESKSGRQAYRARIVIDATGDADVAAFLGAETRMGDPDDDFATQGMTVRFLAGNIDMERWFDFLLAHPELRPQTGEEKIEFVRRRHRRGLPFHLHCDLSRLYEQFGPDEGDLPVKAYFNGCSTGTGTFNVNGTMVHNVLGTDVRDLTKAELLCRRQINHMMAFVRKNVGGWENAILCTMAPHVGVRETRCIVGEILLTEADARAGRKFEDTVCLDHVYFDHHSRKAYTGEAVGQMLGIPLRALLPKGVERLLVVGRCISAEHMVQSSTRIMHVCFDEGAAAGILAAHCVKAGLTPRQLPLDQVSPILRAAGINPLKCHEVYQNKSVYIHRPDLAKKASD